MEPDTKKVIKKIPIGSSVLKCSLVAETCLFLGLATGLIQMYDAYTLEFVAQTETVYHVPPSAMILK